MAETIQSELLNAEDFQRRLHAIEASNPKMRRDINKMIRYVLREARKEVMKDAKSNLPNDPRDAYKAVRHSVYKRVFGGQVDILQRKGNNSKMSTYHPQRTLRPGQRGGNRWGWGQSPRTQQINSYYGDDRGFILRFINGGTVQRTAGITDYMMNKANRGSIRARNWFGSSAKIAVDRAAGNLEALVSRAIYEVWGDNAVNAGII